MGLQTVIIDCVTEFPLRPIFARVHNIIRNDVELLLKIEGFNPGGSLKLKPALALVRDLERHGLLRPGMTMIETTSGNMGIALSLIARAKGYRFVCVSDEKITTHNRRLIKAYGSQLKILPGSTHRERCEYIESRLAKDPRTVWTRQFASNVNPESHETTTALEIINSLKHVDRLFIGVGTGGTIAGCAATFNRLMPKTKIIAVDAEGSCHFSDCRSERRRLIPGIGATERSQFIDPGLVDCVVIVPEWKAIDVCRKLAEATGWLLGGSSGSVVSAVIDCASSFGPGERIVAICADFGERYLQSVYNDRWVKENFS